MNNSEENIDLNSVFSEESRVSIDESNRLKLAKQVLCWLGFRITRH